MPPLPEGLPRVKIPGLNGPLVSYQQFMSMQREPVEAAEAGKRYEEYKVAHSKKQDEIFFSLHKVNSRFPTSL